MSEQVRRLIEVDLPIRRLSEHARREKSLRHGHISTLHIWWARRPLASCRGVLLASLIPDPADPGCPASFRKCAAALMRELRDQTGGQVRNWDDPIEVRESLLDFVADFANWDLAGDEAYLRVSRELVAAGHAALSPDGGALPMVADPFAGGGAIPLEALRIGANVYASDLNPVPILLNKTVLQYASTYGVRLAETVEKVGTQIGLDAQQELAQFYATAKSETCAAFLWARTVLSEEPDASAAPVEIPLLSSMWLSKKKGRKWALRWVRSRGKVQTTTVDVIYADGTKKRVRRPMLEVFSPTTDKEVEPGSCKGGAAICPLSGFTTPVESVRVQLAPRRGGAADARLLAVVVSRNSSSRYYRAPTDGELRASTMALAEFSRRDQAARKQGESLLPNGRLNHLRGFFNVVLYGIQTWGDMFAPRQALSLTTFVAVLAERMRVFSLEEPDKEFARAVHTCLALAVDRLAEKLSSVARWDTSRENPQGTFGRQALPMVWDFCEVNPFSGSGGDWGTALDWVVKVLRTNARALERAPGTGHVESASATQHPLPDDSVDAVFTDPPYYAAVPYADLSDFFFSWLKRTLGDVHPALFEGELSPKDLELVSLAHRAAMYRNKDGPWFEKMMAQACAEARRVCRPNGVGIFVFASKDTPAWEAMLSALVQSGWIVTASWPIDTEMGSRLRARNSATLASSIHIVCRPREDEHGNVRDDTVADWRDVLNELPPRIKAWLPRLAQEGIVGADAIFACIGPALEVFTKFSRVEKASGDVVTLREFLEQVWAAVSREALSMLFSAADASGLEEDARLTAMWLWTLAGPQLTGAEPAPDAEPSDDEDDGADVSDDDGSSAKKGSPSFVLEFDAARKIAQGLGANLDGLETVVEVKGDKARLLTVAERTPHLFAAAQRPPVARKKTKKQGSLFAEVADDEGWGDVGAPHATVSVLDRVHQAMLLFAAGRSEAMRRFLVEDAVGKQPRFWKLAQSLSALYPPGSDEKRWIDGVLARKKGLGF